jgi:hypothetical protein
MFNQKVEPLEIKGEITIVVCSQSQSQSHMLAGTLIIIRSDCGIVQICKEQVSPGTEKPMS